MTETATETPRYQAVRFLILRLLGLVYLVAFLVVVDQALPLIGHDGLTPADDFISRVVETRSRWSAFWESPSLFWAGISDGSLLAVGWVGVVLSGAVLLGFANAPILFVLWALYLSVIHVGQVWWGYGWENQLTETGFLAIFLVPWLDPRPWPAQPPPRQVIWLFRWLTFRIFLGAGLIKLRGDACWRDLTCLDFHFLTQPNPNPLSPLFYYSPVFIHRFEVLYNHLVEVVCPFFVFGPRRLRLIAATLMLVFQVTLILSGNLSFLNWLTIVPLLASLDDQLLERLSPARLRALLAARLPRLPLAESRAIAAWALFALVVVLSIPTVENLVSSEQRMNTSHEPFELVNSYGAFGTVGRVRNEIIFEGTSDALGPDARWIPYEFKCKPGDPDRRPCWISPYHYRLDWQIWFAAMEDVSDEPWTVHFVEKLLKNDPQTLGLLAGNPFPVAPPRSIRAELYEYSYAPLGARAWWTRKPVGEWLPPLSLDDPRLQKFMDAFGWH